MSEQPSTLAVSAISGAGFTELISSSLADLGFAGGSPSTPFSARERHIDALNRAHSLLLEASTRFGLSGAGELLAEDLRKVHEVLSSITGTFSADDLLGEIFSSFCIGK